MKLIKNRIKWKDWTDEGVMLSSVFCDLLICANKQRRKSHEAGIKLA